MRKLTIRAYTHQLERLSDISGVSFLDLSLLVNMDVCIILAITLQKLPHVQIDESSLITKEISKEISPFISNRISQLQFRNAIKKSAKLKTPKRKNTGYNWKPNPFYGGNFYKLIWIAKR